MEENQPLIDERKYHKLNPKKKPLYVAVAVVFIFIILPFLIWQYFQVALTRPAQNDRETMFKIDRGEGVSSISERLYTQGLINSRALFNLYVLGNNLQSKIQAGTYKIPAGLNVKELINLFQQGKDDVSVTFLEGWRLEEIAVESSSKLKNVDIKSFITQAREFEGELFPDTYQFNSNASEGTVIKVMHDNFLARTQELLGDSNLSKIGLTKKQVVILASIVEREVSNEADRKIVAGILIKRFMEGQLLGADATTQYAVGSDAAWWPKNLTIENLSSTSPYNTRKVAGLPPAPICNPGASAFESVINYQATSYNYYLTDTQGVTHFARSLEEHNKNVFKYLQGWN